MPHPSKPARAALSSGREPGTRPGWGRAPGLARAIREDRSCLDKCSLKLKTKQFTFNRFSEFCAARDS